MIDKHISEIRRRFKYEKNNITSILGCYVNERKEIISKFSKPLSMMHEEETDMFLSLLKKVLTGSVGKTLIDIEFSVNQVQESENHKLLMNIRASETKEEEYTDELFNNIINSVNMEGNYLILLAMDKYDIPYKGKDGGTFSENSSEVFNYFITAICPVKEAKSNIIYSFENKMFERKSGNYIASPPVLGFMFPSFEDRTTNIYHSMLYSKDMGENQGEFIDKVFGSEIPMSAPEQMESFQSILAESLQEECSLDVVAKVHDKFSEMIETHKVNKEVEPLLLSKNEVKSILEDCGVDEEKVEDFDGKYIETFGEDTLIRPANVMNMKQFEIKTPSIVVKVNTDRKGLVHTDVIDGKKYIMISAEETVEINGVIINVD